jgi:RHS repeat-associated protein
LIKIEHSDDYDEETPTWTTVVQYEYDGLNRRVKKDLASGTDVVYLWDRWQMLEEQELDGETWEARRQYVYGGLYIDEPVTFDKDTDSDGDCTEGNGGSTRYLYAQQANFNVVALTDSAGAAVETVKYDPYGQATCRRVSDGHEQASSHFENALLFTGHPYDSESGLYYARNRYYHPALGRWLSRDQAGYVDGMSRYEYVASEPVDRSDPEGLAAQGGAPGADSAEGDSQEDVVWRELNDPEKVPIQPKSQADLAKIKQQVTGQKPDGTPISGIAVPGFGGSLTPGHHWISADKDCCLCWFIPPVKITMTYHGYYNAALESDPDKKANVIKHERGHLTGDYAPAFRDKTLRKPLADEVAKHKTKATAYLLTAKDDPTCLSDCIAKLRERINENLGKMREQMHKKASDRDAKDALAPILEPKG